MIYRVWDHSREELVCCDIAEDGTMLPLAPASADDTRSPVSEMFTERPLTMRSDPSNMSSTGSLMLTR